MWNFGLLAVEINICWYAIPLVAAISLVYSASRYERTDVILERSVRLFGLIMICLAAAVVVLLLLSSRL